MSRHDRRAGWLSAERLSAERLKPAFESSRPLVVLWTWPDGGASTWLEAILSTFEGARSIDPSELPVAARRLSSGELGVLRTAPPAAVLEASFEVLRPGAKLVVAGSPCPCWGLIPAHVVKPRQLALDRDQMTVAAEAIAAEAIAADAIAADARARPSWSPQDLDALHELTGGWFGPTCWLLEHFDPQLAALHEKPLQVEDEEASIPPLSRALEQAVQAVLPCLDVFERHALAEVLTAEKTASSEEFAVDRELGRRAFLDQPAHLAAFERLHVLWGLLGDQAPPLRSLLPMLPLLVEGTGAIDPRALSRRLASATASLERPADVATWLQHAGEPRTARHFLALTSSRSRDEPSRAASTRSGTRSGTRPERKPEVPGDVVFRVRLLGSPTVARVHPDGREEELAWRLHRSLLCVGRLALAPGHRLPRGELIETLWPSASADHVRRNFHPTLSCARTALAGGSSLGRAAGIVNRQGTYGLDPDLEWQIDVEELTRELARANEARASDAQASDAQDPETELEALQRAWRLYRGRLLDGIDGEWIEEPRQRLHRHYLGMLARLGDVASSLDRETLALDAYRCLLIEEPFEERIHVELMEIYGRHGRRDLVRRQFVRLQELLKDLHVEPHDETVERYHQLMS